MGMIKPIEHLQREGLQISCFHAETRSLANNLQQIRELPLFSKAINIKYQNDSKEGSAGKGPSRKWQLYVS